MKNAKVSIIMPTLNVVQYIEVCLRSVLEQTLDDIEILVIDAGSTDGTLEIIQQYAREDDRICFIHSEEKSYGYQINLGIKEASSDYIGIVETDDIIDLTMYEVLYKYIVENELDYVKCGHSEMVTTKAQLDKKFLMPKGIALIEEVKFYELISEQNQIEMLLRDFYLWRGLYRKEFLVRHKIRLNESKGAAYQDVGFAFQVSTVGGKMMYIDENLYYYRRDNENSSIYQERSYQYIQQEYEYIEKQLKEKLEANERLQAIYYLRMFQQTIIRLDFLSIFKRSYELVKNDILPIQKKLKQAIAHGALTSFDMSITQWIELQKFIENAQLISENIELHFLIKRREVQTFIRQAKMQEQVIIFGAGKWGKYCNAFLEKNEVNIHAFCDNSLALAGTMVNGVPVISLEEAIGKKETTMYIIATMNGGKEIREQLYQRGIEYKNMVQYHFGCDINLFYLVQ